MRLTILLLTASFLNVQATGLSQTITLSCKNLELKQVFVAIRDQTDYVVFFNQDDLKATKPVSLNAHEMALTDFLQEVFKKQPVTYTIRQQTIFIAPRPQPSDSTGGASLSFIDLAPPPITGIVRGVDGLPLTGVNIVVKGTNKGTASGNDGQFSIDARPGDILVFTSIGLGSKEIRVSDSGKILVTLEISNSPLDEVQFIAYGTTSRRLSTGAVATVKGQELEKAPVINLSANLAGRVPGLTATTPGGEPGRDGAVLRIRGANTLGNNDPLIVVDGIPNRQGGLERIDPNDIKSISVLKDASAAIYGAQAANGIILITTKRGVSGKTRINYNFNQGFAQPTRQPEMADASTYATMMNELARYRGSVDVYTAEQIEKFKDGSDPLRFPNTNWYDLLMKKFSLQSRHNITINGGTERIRYFASLGLQGQDGFYEKSATRFNQQNIRVNLDAKVNDYIDISLNVHGRQEVRNLPTMDTRGIYEELMIAKPTAVAVWPDGSPGPPVRGRNNPVVTVTDEAGYNRERDYYLQNHLQLQVRNPWIKNLSLTANATFDKNFEFNKLFAKPFTTYVWDNSTVDANGQPALAPLKDGDPTLNEFMSDGQQITVNGLLNYKMNFSDHSINVLAGMERFSARWDNLSAFRRYFISTAIDQMFAGGDLEKNNGGTAWHGERLNYFGRVNYDYKKKYLFEFLWRYDGSYIFPETKRFGFFPGVMAGWQVSEEDFWKEKVGFMNYFKIRGSWGQTGNDRIDEYQYLNSFGFGGAQIFGIDDENKSIFPSRIGNPNVTWEVANQANLGVEGEMFNGRLSFEVDIFNNKRTNILWLRNASVPAYTGLTLPRENIGTVRNKGIDYRVSYRNSHGNFSYSISHLGGFTKNKILFWDETPGAEEWQKSTGRPMNSELFYKAIGVFNNDDELAKYPKWTGARTGDIIFEDINGDGKIDSKDRVRSEKTSLPTYAGSFNIELSYKQVDLSILIQGSTGGVRYIKTLSGNVGNYLKEFADNRWSPETPDAEHPRAFNRDEQYWMSLRNTYFLRSTDYMRLKNVQLGYSLPKKIISRIGMESLRIYASGFNLLTIDDLKILDPESTQENGWYYPLQRIFNMGFSLTF